MTVNKLANGLALLRIELANRKPRSAWDRGMNVYATELLAELLESVENGYVTADDLCNSKLVKKQLLNGAEDWREYSYGGCSLIYDSEIAKRLCTPSEFKRVRNGDNPPNSRETWLDVQARALSQACARINARIVAIANENA